MPYYIISFEQERMREFARKLPFLDDATWVKEKNNLASIKPSPGEDPFFFVHLTKDREELDEWVLIIRDTLVAAKIIYVIEEKMQDMKAHQLTPVGGDAYVPLTIEPSQLANILESLLPPDINPHGNRLESNVGNAVHISAQQGLEELKNHPKSKEIEAIFSQIFNQTKKPLYQSANSLVSEPVPDEMELGEDMSDKDQDLSLDDLGDLELSTDAAPEAAPLDDGGLDLSLDDDIGLDLSAPDELPTELPEDDGGMDLNLDEGLSLDDSPEADLSLSEEAPAEEASADDDFGLSLDDDAPEVPDLGSEEPAEEDIGLSFDEPSEDVPDLDFTSPEGDDVGLDLGGDDDVSLDLGGDDDVSLDLGGEEAGEDVALDLGGDEPSEDVGLDLATDDGLSLSDDLDLGGGADVDLSDDALEKLKEIDAIMDEDASKVGIDMNLASDSDEGDELLALGGEDEALDLGAGLDLGEETVGSDLETSLVSDDLNLDSINFSSEEEEEEKEVAAPVKEEKNKKKSKEVVKETYDGNIGQELKEISGAYSGEMERMQATISNLRLDREELLAKITKLEEDRVLQNRQSLSMRAELDEKKIELSIIRKKLNDEITELKDRLKLHEEKKMILEEKNKILMVELDKAAQKNKIDVKKVQLRERELEQRLELLKSDSETQIRHRDLKILELKRKIDAMEFDMESISMQEKRSVESRFELEDKLDKAIKTLRSAISVLEDESEKSGALDALKKNIDM